MSSAPDNPGVGNSPGNIAFGILPPSGSADNQPGAQLNDAERSLAFAAAQRLAGEIGDLLSELRQARRALGQREAELAAGVPVVIRPDEPSRLAERLESVLRGGAEAVGCHAAGLYLLDAATTELKLRSCWGLPSSRLLAAPRELRGSIADLEALSGSAVVLEDDSLGDYWRMPEPYAAAVCVPVSSPSSLLGTLWIYSRQPREFSDAETNQIEIVAGRLAADLEREMLISEGAAADGWRRQLDRAERLQESQSPQLAPLLDGWDLAGWIQQAQSLGGAFYDWSMLPSGALSFAVGDALDGGAAAALVASSIRTAIRAHAEYQPDAGQLLAQVNRTLWTCSAGDQFASVLFGRLQPEKARLQFASAGQVGAILLRGNRWESLSQATLPLALQPDSQYGPRTVDLEPGSTLVVYTDGLRAAAGSIDLPYGGPLDEETLAQTLLAHADAPARKLAAIARDLLQSHADDEPADDCALLVIRRDR